jgi:Rieske Fe-S protein
MSTRREFLKTVATTFITAAGCPLLFENCAGGGAIYRAKLIDNTIAIPKREIEHLKTTHGYLTVRESSLPGAVILRFVDDEGLVALHNICSHRGCEVQPLPNAFECPCHGSEYDVHGNVLDGPARLPLKRFEVEERPDVWIIKIS